MEEIAVRALWIVVEAPDLLWHRHARTCKADRIITGNAVAYLTALRRWRVLACCGMGGPDEVIAWWVVAGVRMHSAMHCRNLKR
jgi:hypothetical protein